MGNPNTNPPIPQNAHQPPTPLKNKTSLPTNTHNPTHYIHQPNQPKPTKTITPHPNKLPPKQYNHTTSLKNQNLIHIHNPNPPTTLSTNTPNPFTPPPHLTKQTQKPQIPSTQ